MNQNNNMLEIDGSHGEGGGQILRTSLTMSCITQRAIHITNIRANRSNPGLKAQHIMAAHSVRKICRGKLSNLEIGARELTFKPGKIVPGKYKFDVGTAGSVILVAQTIIPLLMFSNKKSKIEIIGGTHVMHTPTFDYFKYVFIRALHKIGFKGIDTMMKRPGYYPRGNGSIEIVIDPDKNNPVKQNKDDWISISEKAIIQISNLPMHIAIREKKIFIQNEIEDVIINEDNGLDPGNAITYYKGYVGASILGKKGRRAEDVAKEVIQEVKNQIENGYTIDKHLGDQLMIYGIIGNGLNYNCEITNHTKTNMHIINKFIENAISIEEGKIDKKEKSEIKIKKQEPSIFHL